MPNTVQRKGPTEPYTTALHSSKEGSIRAIHNFLKQFKGRGPIGLYNCPTQFKERGQQGPTQLL